MGSLAFVSLRVIYYKMIITLNERCYHKENTNTIEVINYNELQHLRYQLIFSIIQWIPQDRLYKPKWDRPMINSQWPLYSVSKTGPWVDPLFGTCHLLTEYSNQCLFLLGSVSNYYHEQLIQLNQVFRLIQVLIRKVSKFPCLVLIVRCLTLRFESHRQQVASVHKWSDLCKDRSFVWRQVWTRSCPNGRRWFDSSHHQSLARTHPNCTMWCCCHLAMWSHWNRLVISLYLIYDDNRWLVNKYLVFDNRT